MAGKPECFTDEAAVLRACLALLTLRGVPHWRANTGAARIGDRFVRFGSPGMADVIFVVPRSGRFGALEAKRPGAKPTGAQLAFLTKVLQSGGVAMVISDVRDLHRALDVLDADPWAGFNIEGPLP